MRILRAALRRVTGADVRLLRTEVVALRELVDGLSRMMMDLNHDIRSGAEGSLPLQLGYLERLRLDADTAVAAVETIERQLAERRALADRSSR